MRVIVFGTGDMYQKNKTKLKYIKKIVFLDNAKDKQGTWMDGIYIDAPENVSKYDYDYVFLLSAYFKEMREQLLKLGVPEEKILDKEHQGQFKKLITTKRYQPEAHMKSDGIRGKILLFSHEMTLTGAPRVLYNMACVLKDAGYYVEVYALQDGEMTYEYLQREIPVTCVCSMSGELVVTVEDIIREYDLVIVNTVILYGLIQQFNNIKIPVIWWIHEVENAYLQYGLTQNHLKVGENIKVYGVGEKAIKVYQMYSGQQNIKELLYGIDSVDIKNEGGNVDKKKLVFAVIATLSERKGQDIYEDSVNKNWENWQDKAEFWMMGRMASGYKRKYETSGVKYLGEMDYQELLTIYENIDVLVCPSRFDTMPVVLAEAMMRKKACIVSDAVGTVCYLKSYENAIICRNNDVNSLTEAIQWSLSHRAELRSIGEKGHAIFQDKFSMEQFRKNTLKIVGECMEKKYS